MLSLSRPSEPVAPRSRAAGATGPTRRLKKESWNWLKNPRSKTVA